MGEFKQFFSAEGAWQRGGRATFPQKAFAPLLNIFGQLGGEVRRDRQQSASAGLFVARLQFNVRGFRVEVNLRDRNAPQFRVAKPRVEERLVHHATGSANPNQLGNEFRVQFVDCAALCQWTPFGGVSEQGEFFHRQRPPFMAHVRLFIQHFYPGKRIERPAFRLLKKPEAEGPNSPGVTVSGAGAHAIFNPRREPVLKFFPVNILEELPAKRVTDLLDQDAPVFHYSGCRPAPTVARFDSPRRKPLQIIGNVFSQRYVRPPEGLGFRSSHDASNDAFFFAFKSSKNLFGGILGFTVGAYLMPDAVRVMVYSCPDIAALT